jgi:hypothetical protein
LDFKFVVVQIESYEEMTNIHTVDLEELLIVHIHDFSNWSLKVPRIFFWSSQEFKFKFQFYKLTYTTNPTNDQHHIHRSKLVKKILVHDLFIAQLIYYNSNLKLNIFVIVVK